MLRYSDDYDEAPPVDQYFTVPAKSLHVKHSMTCLHQNNKACLDICHKPHNKANIIPYLPLISYLPHNKSSLNMSHIIHLHHNQEDSFDIYYVTHLPHTHTHTTSQDAWPSFLELTSPVCWDDNFYTICHQTYARRLYCPMSLSNE